jgi:hypothetical protein
VLSISRSGEVAVLLVAPGSPMGITWGAPEGTLARIPLAGGTPREMLEDVLGADWSPDGTELAVSRWVEGTCRLEYPIGHVLHETEQRVPVVRVSPHGDKVGFLEGATAAASLANVSRLIVVDRTGRKEALFEGRGTGGIAWSASGREIWLDTWEDVEARARGLRAVALSGESRLVAQVGVNATLVDVSRQGRALIVGDHGRHTIFALAPGEDRERNLSWHDDSTVVDLSRDGRTLLFSEVGGVGRSFGTSVRRTDGSPAVRLGEGNGQALSPDGRWALAFIGSGPSLEFVLWPTGAGEPKHLTEGLPAEFHGASWLPDSRSFVFSGSSQAEGARLYRQGVEGTPPRPLTEADIDLTYPVVSPDGRKVAAIDAYGGVVMAPLAGGDVRPLPGVEENEIPVQWRADAQALYVYRPNRLPVEVFEVDVASGRRQRVREIVLPDLTGVDRNVVVALTPDARSYAYSFYRHLDELYLVEGLE